MRGTLCLKSSLQLRALLQDFSEVKSKSYLQKNSNGLLPAVKVANEFYYESGAIMQFLLEKFGKGKLVPASSSPQKGTALMHATYNAAVVHASRAWLVRYTQAIAQDFDFSIVQTSCIGGCQQPCTSHSSQHIVCCCSKFADTATTKAAHTEALQPDRAHVEPVFLSLKLSIVVASCRQISAVAVVSGSHLQPTSDRNHTPHETATSGAEDQRGKGCMICRIRGIAMLLLSLPQAFCCALAPATVPCLDKSSNNASDVVVIVCITISAAAV